MKRWRVPRKRGGRQEGPVEKGAVRDRRSPGLRRPLAALGPLAAYLTADPVEAALRPARAWPESAIHIPFQEPTSAP